MMHGTLNARPSAACALRSARSTRQSSPSHRRSVLVRAGLLDFLTPTGAKTSKRPARSTELVDQLLELTRGTDGGLKASPNRKDDIMEVVEELSNYCMKSPLRSDLIFGQWEVVYASKPQTAGGPFRSPLGRTVFPGQRAIQVIAEPNVCVNEVSYKALGFVPGSVRQEGEIEPISETAFQLTFPTLDNKKRGAGGPPQRVIEVVYLDERIRVAAAIPQNEEDEPSFYVFERVAEEVGEEEEEEEEEPAPAPVRQKARGRATPAPAAVAAAEKQGTTSRVPSFDFGTQIFNKREGFATKAERDVASKAPRSAPQPPRQSGTQKKTTQQARAAPAPPPRKSREELAAERAAAKAKADEERRRAAEQAAAARAQAAEERRVAKEKAEQERLKARAAAEAERAAALQRQAAAREQYQQLAAEATEAANEAREAASAYKGAEREATALLRAASQARDIIGRAIAAAEEAAAELAAAQSQEFTVEKEVLEEQRLVNQLEKKLRDVSAAVAPRLGKK